MIFNQNLFTRKNRNLVNITVGIWFHNHINVEMAKLTVKSMPGKDHQTAVDARPGKPYILGNTRWIAQYVGYDPAEIHM